MSLDERAKANLRPDTSSTGRENTESKGSVLREVPERTDTTQRPKEVDPSRLSGRGRAKDGIDNSDLRALLAMAIEKASRKE